jgi:hypothetical protein
MNDTNILDHSVEDIARGYAQHEHGWACLICHSRFEDGIVYQIGGKQYEAYRAVRDHVASSHGLVFTLLLETLAEKAGLTARQAEALGLMASGLSDRAITARLSGSDNTASIRNLRHQLKERERQARALLAIMGAFRLESGSKAEARLSGRLPAHEGATLADGRFDATEAECRAVLKAYFYADGSLKDFPVREKRKIIVLREIAERFERGRAYTEKEVNGIIAWPDFATVRRYLIEYGFMERTADCSEYRVKEKTNDTDRSLPE